MFVHSEHKLKGQQLPGGGGQGRVLSVEKVEEGQAQLCLLLAFT